MEKDPLPTSEEVKSMPKCPDFPVIWPNIEKLMAFYSLSREDAARILVQIHGPEPKEETKETLAKGKKATEIKEKNTKSEKEEMEMKENEKTRKSALRKPPPKTLTAEELKMDAQPPRPDLVPKPDPKEMEEEEGEEEEEDEGAFWPPHPSEMADDENESDLDGEELDEIASSTSSGGGPPKDPPPRGGAKVPEVKTTIMDEMETFEQPEPTLQHIPTPEVEKVEEKNLKEEIKKAASPMKAGCFPKK